MILLAKLGFSCITCSALAEAKAMEEKLAEVHGIKMLTADFQFDYNNFYNNPLVEKYKKDDKK
jgi:molybdate-binding protein